MSYPYHYTRRKRTFGDWLFDNAGVIGGAFVALFVVGLIVLIPVSTNAWVNAKHSYQHCVVENKESVNKDKTHEYRVYTENCGVFSVSDEAWLGLWNSADTYGKIKIGQTYNFETVGWRNGFFSQFENIVKVS